MRLMIVIVLALNAALWAWGSGALQAWHCPPDGESARLCLPPVDDRQGAGGPPALHADQVVVLPARVAAQAEAQAKARQEQAARAARAASAASAARAASANKAASAASGARIKP